MKAIDLEKMAKEIAAAVNAGDTERAVKIIKLTISVTNAQNNPAFLQKQEQEWPDIDGSDYWAKEEANKK